MVLEAAAKGFSAGADAYAANRPSYPSEALQFISGNVITGDNKVIVDVGAGTGIFTRLLSSTFPNNKIIAVEPVENMRAKIGTFPNVEIKEGTAEKIPLADNSVDAVVAAQAFHWFCTAEALAEIRRVLKPGGVLCLVWNMMDHSVDWIKKFDDVADHLWTSDANRYRSGKWRDVFNETDLYEPLQHKIFRNAQEGNLDTLIGRILSRSVVAKSPPEIQKKISEDVTQLLTTHPDTKGKSIYHLVYNTDIYFTSCKK
eukprot:Phypoly_transcript_13704.p1 GENE.Phypoly_transcript_13704~~Phypoly_transcript_13704.p1  ORF type:complete len:257 (+),score=40.97 Phypoly_transcript_13704:67-837(+)